MDTNCENQNAPKHKSCHYCGEEILSVAIKCKHCGSDLTKVEKAHKEKTQKTSDFGVYLLIAPMIATFFVWFWVPQLNRLQSPMAALSLITIITVVLTGTLSAIETNSAQGTYSLEDNSSGPVGWFISVTFVWVLGYPLYMYKRKFYGLKNHLISSCIISAIFTASVLYIGFFIDRVFS